MQTIRAPRVFWANAYCLLDRSSGASIHACQMLEQLKLRGFEIAVLGATIFDSESGAVGLGSSRERILSSKSGQVVKVVGQRLEHDLVVTKSTKRSHMTEAEQTTWRKWFVKKFHEFKPDLLIYYGGQALDAWATQVARARDVPVVALVVNGNYHGLDWCYNADLLLTDSESTAQLYNHRAGIEVAAVGTFIDKRQIIAPSHKRTHVTFVNPAPSKGSIIVAALAAFLEEKRPDIMFDVIETRSEWSTAVRALTKMLGRERDVLSNVRVRPAMQDIRAVYQDARVVLAPSLWYESGGRVAVEAMMNGLPTVVSSSGGLPEFVRGGGIVVNFSEEMRTPPYLSLPSQESVQNLAKLIEKFFDDEEFYKDWSHKAKRAAEKVHNINANTDRLVKALNPLLGRCAGDYDYQGRLRQNSRLYRKNDQSTAHL